MRSSLIGFCLALFAGFVMAASPICHGQARADMLATKLNVSLCADLGSGSASLATCNGGGAQNFFNTASYGAQQFNGKCLQGTGSNQPLVMAACNGSQDQQWLMENSTGLYRNKGGWCANIRGGGANPGAVVISFACDGSPNEKWLRGHRVSPPNPAVAAAAARSQPGDIINMQGQITGHVNPGLIGNDGASVVAQGGGNVIAQGGGN